MRRALVIMGFCLLSAGMLGALSEDFVSDFRAADTEEMKLQIVRLGSEHPVSELEEFYLHVLDYVISNAGDRITSQVHTDMYSLAMDRLVEAGVNRAALPLWQVFEMEREVTQRIRLLGALEQLGAGNQRLYIRLSGWIQAQNNLAISGTSIERQVLARAVTTATTFDDPVFFSAFLLTVAAKHPDFLDQPARAAMDAFGDQQLGLLVDAVAIQELTAQYQILQYVDGLESLSVAEKAQVAYSALTAAMGKQPAGVEAIIMHRNVRYLAARMLEQAEYTEASGVMVSHFNLAANDFEQRQIPIGQILDTIDALAAVGGEPAARRLIRYLDYLNIQTSSDRPVNPQVMLAVVNGLGRIGSAEAYNSLFYASMLDYQGFVQDAIQDAMKAVRQ